VVKARGIIVGRGSFLGSRISADFYFPPIHHDSCSPFAAVPLNAFEGGPTMAPGTVAHILWARGLAQIRNAIICGIPVPVIDFIGRMLAVYIEPGEPMGVVPDPADSDHVIPVRVRSACFETRGRASLRHAPIKKPRFRGVMKQLPEPLRRQAELKFAGHEGFSKKESARQPKGSGRSFTVDVVTPAL
jgi:hypothetical protein